MKKKTLLSGMQPTGRPHIGNYLGAMRQFVDLQDKYENVYIFVADYHALNSVQNATEMKQNIIDVVLDYLAIGLDPKKIILFQQSMIPAHAELTWIFNTITTMPYLMRAHAFKDAEAKNKEISVGSFDYPMLMAADILLYDTDIVPVGKDQKQHVEFARDTAEKFNRIYGETFVLPEVLTPEDVAVVPGIDGQKMSKSYNNTIPLFASDEEIEKAVMSIVTDSKSPEEPKNPDEDNIFALHRHFSKDQLDDLEKRYREGGIGYKESKEILIKNLIEFITPLREKRRSFTEEDVRKVLLEGTAKAKEVADRKIHEVKRKIGVEIYE